MEKRFTKSIVVLSSLLFLSPVLSLGEGFEDLKQGLVRIAAEAREGGRTTVGAGTILELKSDYALVLTAASVVAGRRGLVVELASDPSKAMPVTFINMEGGEPHGVAALFVEGHMPAQASPLELAGQLPVHKGNAVVAPGIPVSGQEWTLIAGKIADRKGRILSLSLDGELSQPGGPLITDGQVVGIVTEVSETSAYGTPALLASYALEGWGVLDRRQSELAGTLAGESIALLHQVEHRTREEEGEYWWKLIKEETRAELLRRSLLLALESLRRSPSANARKALRSGLVLLAYPIIETDSTTAFAFSPDGQYLVTVYDPDQDYSDVTGDNVARIWEVATGEEFGRLWHDSELTSLRISPDSKYLATGTKAGTVRVWEMETLQQQVEWTHDSPVQSLAFSPGGKYLATGTRAGTVHLRAMKGLQLAAELAHDAPVRALAFTPDGSELLTITREKASAHAYLWDVATAGKRLHLDQSEIASFILGPQGQFLAARSRSDRRPGRLWIWALSTGKEILHAQFEHAPEIAISASGRYLAASSLKEPARVWSLSEGRELLQIPTGGMGRTLAFSPDDRFLAVGSSVWDLGRALKKGKLVSSDRSPTLTGRVFSPDGRYLASPSSSQGWIRVLALSNGEEVARFTLPGVVDVDFSPDGQYLGARAGPYGQFRLWRLWPDDPVSEACRCVRRNLTYEEWRRYIGDEPYRKTCEAQP